MEPEVSDETYPLYGKVSVPRMIIAQIDSFNGTRNLGPLRSSVLKKLEKMLMANGSVQWFTVYVCTFILLHEVAVASRDRYRHARQNFHAVRVYWSSFHTPVCHAVGPNRVLRCLYTLQVTNLDTCHSLGIRYQDS
jgi:hypothetical protein